MHAQVLWICRKTLTQQGKYTEVCTTRTKSIPILMPGHRQMLMARSWRGDTAQRMASVSCPELQSQVELPTFPARIHDCAALLLWPDFVSHIFFLQCGIEVFSSREIGRLTGLCISNFTRIFFSSSKFYNSLLQVCNNQNGSEQLCSCKTAAIYWTPGGLWNAVLWQLWVTTDDGQLDKKACGLALRIRHCLYGLWGTMVRTDALLVWISRMERDYWLETLSAIKVSLQISLWFLIPAIVCRCPLK
jgi:hypothetical protein